MPEHDWICFLFTFSDYEQIHHEDGDLVKIHYARSKLYDMRHRETDSINNLSDFKF